MNILFSHKIEQIWKIALEMQAAKERMVQAVCLCQGWNIIWAPVTSSILKSPFTFSVKWFKTRRQLCPGIWDVTTFIVRSPNLLQRQLCVLWENQQLRSAKLQDSIFSIQNNVTILTSLVFICRKKIWLDNFLWLYNFLWIYNFLWLLTFYG